MVPIFLQSASDWLCDGYDLDVRYIAAATKAGPEILVATLMLNHKRVYRVMRDAGWLLFRQGQKPLDTRKHEGKVAVNESNTRWCSDGLELSCDGSAMGQLCSNGFR